MITETLETIFTSHNAVALWCSGGKDSLTLLHMARPWRHKVCVIHMYEPETWPGVTENLNDCLDAWGFLRNIHIEPSVSFAEYTQQYGWPVSHVPSDYDGTAPSMSPYWDGTIKLASWWHCSVIRQIQPLGELAIAMGTDAVLTGSRAQDGPWFVREGSVVDAGYFTRYDPLHTLSATQVYAYIDEHNIPLPPHYAIKRQRPDYEWVDCLSCTWAPQHWQILKEFYPEEFEKRWPAARKVFEILKQENTKMRNDLALLPE